MSKIVLIKAQNPALDNNSSTKQERNVSDGVRLSGKIAEIKSNGTLIFATESMGNIVIADPGNLHLGDFITIELHRDNVAAVGKLVTINQTDVKGENAQSPAQVPVILREERIKTAI